MTVEDRLVSCSAAALTELSPEELKFADRDANRAWDSLVSPTIITLIEQEFGIEADLLAMGEVCTFSTFLAYVTEHASA